MKMTALPKKKKKQSLSGFTKDTADKYYREVDFLEINFKDYGGCDYWAGMSEEERQPYLKKLAEMEKRNKK